MRWGQLKVREKGQTRIIFKFLWLPLKLQGQTRWLEMVAVKQWSNPFAYMTRWEDIAWVDDVKFVDADGKKQEIVYENITNREERTIEKGERIVNV